MQVKIAEHAQLEGRIDVPVWIRFGDCHCVKVVQNQLHAEKTQDESDRVGNDSRARDRRERISQLRNVVVEVDDWTGEVERRVKNVSEVVAEGEVCWLRAIRYSISFGQIGRIEVFLLNRISKELTKPRESTE